MITLSSNFTILRADDHRRMPWKNGGGVTTEIAVHPEGTDLDAFGWRVSMATVATDGPFSLFQGIDRTLSILEGHGMELDIAGRQPVLITQTSEPLPFPADTATTARLLSGTIVDLNVMTRRGHWKHHVERRLFTSQHRLDSGDGIAMLLSLGSLQIDNADDDQEPAQKTGQQLGALDCVIFEGGLRVRTGIATDAYFIRIEAA